MNENTYQINKTGLEIEKILDKASLLSPYRYYSELYHRDQYLYDIQYHGVDEDWALKYLQAHNNQIPAQGGKCSGIKKGNLWGRNYDWMYNQQVEFAIHVPASFSHYGFGGVAAYAPLVKNIVEKSFSLTEDFTNEEVQNFRLLPFFMCDGVNEHHVGVQINVVPLRENEDITVTHEDAIANLCELTIPYYILAHCKTAAEAKELLQNKINIYPSQTLGKNFHYKSHYMIGDQNEVFVAELNNGVVEIVEKPYITNYELDHVIFPANDLVPTPGNGKATEIGIDQNGSGLERWNLIVNNYNNISSEEDMRNMMNNLLYSKAYTYRENPDLIWYTEFVGNGRTVDSERSEFANALAVSKQMFEEKDRDNPQVWITTHSVVYNLEDCSFTIISQEDTTKQYKFKI